MVIDQTIDYIIYVYRFIDSLWITHGSLITTLSNDHALWTTCNKGRLLFYHIPKKIIQLCYDIHLLSVYGEPATIQVLNFLQRNVSGFSLT